uniref:Chromosome 4 open reading frame 33 n=1 Tax=Poecilia reticulata TaxID=8081 RepID=A0A3P9MVN3_POERE
EEFLEAHTWDSNPVDHEPIRVAYSDGKAGLKIEVSGPFFKGFHPPAEPGLPDLSLRIYEVASSVFLDSTKNNYLGVFPHYLTPQQLLPIEFTTTITGDTWQGQALIPWTYFPPNVNKMNCYASHGIRENRTHEALYPVPKEDRVEGLYPDFVFESDLWRGKA